MMKDIHILFVDDEAYTLNALDRFLRKEPYQKRYAKDGALALEILNEQPVDILVTDMKMPGMDGLTLLKIVKERYPHIVRLALSAFAMTGQLLPCINTGEIFRFITKPIEGDELKKSIWDAIDYFQMLKDKHALLGPLEESRNALKALSENKSALEKKLVALSVLDKATLMFDESFLLKTLSRAFKDYSDYKKNFSCLLVAPDDAVDLSNDLLKEWLSIRSRVIAHRINDMIRSEDFAFLYGAYFFILLPETSLKKALVMGDKVIKHVQSKPETVKERSITPTVSIGVLSFRDHQPKAPQEMLKRAGEMLAKARSAGRSKIHSTM